MFLGRKWTTQKKSEIALAYMTRQKKNLTKTKKNCFNAWKAIRSDLEFLETGKSNIYFLYGFVKGRP